MTNTTNTEQFFTGDFEFIPFRASLDLAPIPAHPTSDDVQLALTEAGGACDASGGLVTWALAAVVWRAEAMRARRIDSSADITGRAVMTAVAERLYCAAREITPAELHRERRAAARAAARAARRSKAAE